MLVIGYGNELRSDDALGPRLTRAIEERHWPGVEVMVVHQLTPELAEPISQADAVVFIDAAVGGSDTVQINRVTPTSAATLRAHSGNPAVLLSLARQVFGCAPRGWSITLPAFNLAFGEHLSPRAERVLPAGMELFERKLGRLRVSAWPSKQKRQRAGAVHDLAEIRSSPY